MGITVGKLYDPSAVQFLGAIQNRDYTTGKAINNLVVDLKKYALWDKMQVIYPMVGGTEVTHKFNLKDPRDLDVAYRLTFSTGINHTADGVVFTIGNNFALVNGLNLQSLSQNNTSFGYYNKSVITTTDARIIVGISSSTSAFQQMVAGYAFTNRYAGIFNSNETISSNNNLGTLGMKVINRVGSGAYSIFDNGNKVETINRTSATPINANITLGRTRTDSANTELNLAFFNIGDGLTDTEAANLYTAVQRFQTTLGRQV